MAKEDNTVNFRGGANAVGAGKHGPTYTGDSAKTKMTSKSNKKLIRLATVLAYVLAVSLAAIVLAIYYICVWDPSSGGQSATTTATPYASNLMSGGEGSFNDSVTRSSSISGAATPGVINGTGAG